MPSIDVIKSEYPLHWLVWNNEYKELDKELSKKVYDKEKRDARGRTPLMLAVTLGHLESARILLQHSTNVNTENRDGWTVVQEAVATGDPELLQLVLERRDFQRYSSRVGGIPELLQKLKEAPDFYVEMKWEFTSWVPLVSRMCPSDTYKVYKQGSNVRIDTTLLGFDQTNWQRGNRSYVFKGQSDSAVMMEVDHETQQVYVEQMRMISAEDLQFLQPSEEAISSRLTTPIVTTYIDTDKISFERNKSGIWGWRSDKCEPVNGYECKVFGASNVELVTKTRTEHLTETDKVKARAPKTPLQSFLGIAEVEEKQALPETNNEEYSHIGNPCNITPEEYFDAEVDLKGRDIGRAEVRRQFSIEEEDELLQFAIQQSLIEAGSEKDEVDIWEALRAQKPSRPNTPNIHAEEERQLQRAIQASLALYQQNLTASSPESGSSALRASPEGGEADSPDSLIVSDHDLQMALVLSQREREEEERQRRQEEEMLEQVLQLSLTEK
ncbi:Ankyrin repeat domain-containing protein 13B [Blattella germanica]|nr:Ankyrin repeat domain-containing protein 13B [Blattella germanica]